jgi:hypothetical protein
LEELGGVGAGEGLVAFDDSFEVGLEGHWFKGSTTDGALFSSLCS